MKCPKCGYTSFETNDSCRKCSTDLTEFKQTHGLTPVVLPADVRARMAAELGVAATEEPEQAEGGNDMFSFDLPQHEEPQAQPAPKMVEDPFSFDTPASAAPIPGPAFSFDTPATPTSDPFAELLESTPTAPKAAAAPAAPAEQGFELNSFSWDDTPEPAQAGTTPQAAPAKKVDDDFSSLFGDLGTPEQKP